MGEFQHRVAALAGCRTNESMGVVKVINCVKEAFAFQWDTACTYSLADPFL